MMWTLIWVVVVAVVLIFNYCASPRRDKVDLSDDE